MSVLETYTGLYFDYQAPTFDQVCVPDIARALANTCRFGGHVKRFYSVAEHAILVAELVAGTHRPLQLAALHHDSHEAYLGDLPTPLKRDLGDEFTTLRQDADRIIALKLGIREGDFHNPIVKAADLLALRIEARDLKLSQGVSAYWQAFTGHTTPPRQRAQWRLGLQPQIAERLFLSMHEALRFRT